MRKNMLLLLVFATMISACGKSKSISDLSTILFEESRSVETTTAESYTENVEKETEHTISSDVEVIEEISVTTPFQFPLSGALPFSEGIGWVQYYEYGGKHARDLSPEYNAELQTYVGAELITSAIDKEGNYLFSLPAGLIRYCSPFHDGYAFYIAGDQKSFYEVIVNTTGKECYRTGTDPERNIEEEHILCYGDGMFLISRHIAGMTENTWQIGAIDAYGNEVIGFEEPWEQIHGHSSTVGRTSLTDSEIRNLSNVPLMTALNGDYCAYHAHPQDTKYYYFSSYAGNGVFCLNSPNSECPILLDMKTRQMNYAYEAYRVVGVTDEYIALSTGEGVVFFDQDLEKIVSVPGKERNVGASDQYEFDLNFTQNDIFAFHALPEISEGKVYANADTYSNTRAMDSPGYYSAGTMKLILPVTLYPELAKWCYAFQDGYAVVQLYGADKKNYVTVIDGQGNECFKPLQINNVQLNGKQFEDLFAVITTSQDLVLLDRKGNTVCNLSKGSSHQLTAESCKDGIMILSYIDHKRTYYRIVDLKNVLDQ